MRYLPKPERIANADNLVDFFSNVSFAPKERIAIVAGHFMLMYNEAVDALVPVIHQDTRNESVRKFAWEMAGDFPVLTFKLGVRLYRQFLGRGLSPNIVLAVNDHQFQNKSFQARFEQVFRQPDKVANLRRRFYEGADIPDAFKSILTEAQLSPTDVILRNELPDSDKNRLGHRTYFFSEKAMRNTFDRRLLKQLKKDDRFRYERRPTPDDPASYALYYSNGAALNEVCLTENGSCGCAGELLEFYLELEQLGFTKVVFFVPQECVLAVNIGTFISTTHSTPSLTVYTASGLGGAGISQLQGKPIELSVHEHGRRLLQTKA